MSHVATVDVEITNLDDLEAACKRIGLELVRGQQTYRWVGQHVGDYPVPDGFSIEDLGKCEHAIRVHSLMLNENGCLHIAGFEQPYSHPPFEIGVVRRRDGREGYQLIWDFYLGGNGLGHVVGNPRGRLGADLPLLKQAYATCATLRVARSQGFKVREEATANGGIRLLMTK